MPVIKYYATECIDAQGSAFAGGQIVIATWCQREETPDNPLTEKDKADLQFLYDEWTHPHFISKEGYSRLMQVEIRHCHFSDPSAFGRLLNWSVGYDSVTK